jgi:dGTPase
MEGSYFSTKRLRKSSGLEDRTQKQLFESDRGRVLFSAPFRRLQSKAQVFSLESNASVRSRLTHSIEVAHVGRYIAQQLHGLAVKKGSIGSSLES